MTHIRILDEFGKFIDLPLNCALQEDSGKIYNIIAGIFFLVGLGVNDFDSISDDMLEKYAKLYHYPETFIKMGGEIHAIPYDPQPLRNKFGAISIFTEENYD